MKYISLCELIYNLQRIRAAHNILLHRVLRDISFIQVPAEAESLLQIRTEFPLHLLDACNIERSQISERKVGL